MPLKWFKCPPDGELIEVKKCLSVRGCRLGQRCATMPYLRNAATDREWKAVTPSQAFNGPRFIYLKEVVYYAEDPHDKAFAILGTGSHDKLSVHRLVRGFVSEQGFDDGIIRGIPDIVEPDEYALGFYILYDYKTSGSFKVALALGLEKTPVEVIGEDGSPILYKTGAKKGTPKMKNIWTPNLKKGIAEIEDWTYQMNRYRILVEEHGFNISRMVVQCIPRDGNTYVAKNRGVDKNVILVEIPRMDNDLILNHYDKLQKEIERSFKTHRPRICNKKESWDGRKCNGYCPVSEECRQMEKDGRIFKPIKGSKWDKQCKNENINTDDLDWREGKIEKCGCPKGECPND